MKKFETVANIMKDSRLKGDIRLAISLGSIVASIVTGYKISNYISDVAGKHLIEPLMDKLSDKFDIKNKIDKKQLQN